MFARRRTAAGTISTISSLPVATAIAARAATDLISFNVERGAEYLKALEAHLGRCIEALVTVAPKA